MNQFIVKVRRSWLLWHWQLDLQYSGGLREPIASGTTWSKKQAYAAAGSWTRVVMRQRGWYNP